MAWNGSDKSNGSASNQLPTTNQPTTKHQPSAKRGLFAALIVVVGAAVAFYFLFGNSNKPVRAAKPEKVAEVAPVGQTYSRQMAAPKTQVTPEPTEKKNVRLENGVKVVSSTVTTNKNGAIIERLVLADGKTKRKIFPPKPLFENASDQLIAMAVSANPGESMPPMPDLASVDRDFAQSLLSPIRIKDDDPDDVKEIKAKVIEARAYLAEEIKKGGTVREALQKYQTDMELYSDSHAMAVAQVKEIRESEGDAAANEFIKKVNESFEARGIPALEISGNTESRRKAK